MKTRQAKFKNNAPPTVNRLQNQCCDEPKQVLKHKNPAETTAAQ